MRLPKQTQPVIRLNLTTKSHLQVGQVMPSGIEDCYKLPGAARQMCIQGNLR